MTDDALTKEQVARELAALDEAADQWATMVGWREQLDQLATMSAGFAGRRVSGPGGAELKMLILRQRNLIDRWVRQAHIEGIVAGSGSKLSAQDRAKVEASV